MTPIVAGLSGPVVSADERAALAAVDPAGIILFARNIVDPVQLRALTDDLRALTGRDDLPVMIDQEGGSVARLGSPHWPDFPGADAFGALYEIAPMTAIRAAYANGLAIGHVLAAAGITMNAAPVLDLVHGHTHPGMIARSFGESAMAVAALGRATVDGMADAGVTAIIKHLPGLGRATDDSHYAAPVIAAGEVEIAADLAPFGTLAGACQPVLAAMVGHAVYPAWDDERPASLSPVVIARVVRGTIGFAGLLLSDDLHMAALSGPIPARAAGVLAAGCDLALCCHADVDELRRIADRTGTVTPAAEGRLAAASRTSGQGGDAGEAIALRDALFAGAGLRVRLAKSAASA